MATAFEITPQKTHKGFCRAFFKSACLLLALFHEKDPR